MYTSIFSPRSLWSDVLEFKNSLLLPLKELFLLELEEELEDWEMPLLFAEVTTISKLTIFSAVSPLASVALIRIK